MRYDPWRVIYKKKRDNIKIFCIGLVLLCQTNNVVICYIVPTLISKGKMSLMVIHTLRTAAKEKAQRLDEIIRMKTND